MRVFKPLQLSLQYKTYTFQKKHYLSVSLLMGFPFNKDEELILEQDLWKALPDLLGDVPVLDLCMPKPCGEVLVYGDFHAPGGIPITAGNTQLKIGPVDKTLMVIGDRYWQAIVGPTKPTAFTTMPIDYERAFGGKGFAKNPIGRGLDEVDVFGEMRRPLPNIEHPARQITSPDARPDPAGFGPLDITWQTRAEKIGTYDKVWQKEHFPGYAPDLDWSHFNAADKDQWIDGYWQGDEQFQITHMHPDKAIIEGYLPGFRARCLIERRTEDEVTLTSDLEMKAESVYLFPAQEFGVLLHRGTIEINTDDGSDVLHLLAAYEANAEPQRPTEYYQTALHNRLDEKQVIKYMMSTEDIIPASERCGFKRVLENGGDIDNKLVKNVEARVTEEKSAAEKQVAEQKALMVKQLQDLGVDPAPFLKLLEGGGKVDEDPAVKALQEAMEKMVPGFTDNNARDVDYSKLDFSQADNVQEKAKELAKAKKQTIKAQLHDALEQVKGTRFEAQMQTQVAELLEKMDAQPPLPRPLKAESLASLHQLFNDPRLAQQAAETANALSDKMGMIDEAAKKAFEAYRIGAHLVTGALPHAQAIESLTQQFRQLVESGGRLAGQDWAGVDASGLDLSGRDLSGCYLEYVDFSGCKLNNCNFNGSILTHCNLTGVECSNASFEAANLGGSCFKDSKIDNCHFLQSVFSNADLSDAALTNCNMLESQYFDTRLERVDLSGSVFSATHFIELNFTDAKLIKTVFRECNFIRNTLCNAKLIEADCAGANFVESTLDGANFESANLSNCRFVGETSIQYCQFQKACLDKANLRDTQAQQSNFEEASFNMADFSGAQLQQTRFYGAVGKRAYFIKSDLSDADFTSVNLMEGSMMKARLTGADMRDSNLYAVEFLDAVVGGTDFTGTNLDLSKLQDWRPAK